MPGLTALPITVAAGIVSTIEGQNQIIGPRPCTFPLPTVAVSMNASTEHAYSWRYVAATRGVDAFQMRRGVDSSDERTMATFIPLELRHSILRLTADLRKIVYRKISNWAVTRSLCADVIRGKFSARGHPSGAVLKLEDDAQFLPDFCGASTRVLEALPSRGDWDILYLGHCAEATHRVRSCRRIQGGPRGHEFVSKGKKPMCTHAYAITRRGARRIYDLLEGWPSVYLERVLAAAEPGKGFPGNNTPRMFWQVDWGHDFELAHLIKRNELDAFLAWPPTVVQPWQLSRRTSSDDILRPAPSRLPAACGRS